jgi:hypothetical protein
MYSIQSAGTGPGGPVRYFWIPNFGDVYVIGDDGSLWSRNKKVGWNWVLSDDWLRCYPSPNNNGYLRASLHFNGVHHTKIIHQLVCEAVYGPCPVGLEACHNNGNKFNNWHWNLRYDTPIGNSADRVQHGTDPVGERNSRAILDWIKVREIRAKWNSRKYTQNKLALEYQVSKGCIEHIIYNRTWIEEEVLV